MPRTIFHRFLIIGFSMLVYSKEALAQVQGDIMESTILNASMPFTITQYSTKDGLPQNQVHFLRKKKSGELIIHTSNGIVEFNGYEFKSVNHNPNDKKQIFENIHYFENKNILAGQDSEDKLFFISPQYREFQIKDVRPRYCVSNSDSLFVISEIGDVYLFDITSRRSKLLFRNYSSHLYGSDVSISGGVVKGKKIYLADKSGIYCIDLERKKLSQLSRLNYNTLTLNPYNDKIYATLNQSISVIENDHVQPPVEINTGKPYRKIYEVLFTGSNSFFMATMNGLIVVNKDSLAHYTKEDGLPAYALHALYYDSANRCIYTGSDNKGLLKLQFKDNYNLYTPQGFETKSTISITETPQKEIFTISGSSFYKYSQNKLELYARRREDYSSLSSINGLLYAGTWGDGVLIFNGLKLQDTLLAPKNLSHNNIHSCFQDSKGMIWIGTERGISKGKEKSDIKPVFVNRIKETVICFYELRNGTICIGSTNGFYLVQKDSIVFQKNIRVGYKGKEVRSFYEDKKGRLWIGSYGGGLFCYENNKFTSINDMKNCMLNVDVFCMAKDQYGYFYMSSNYGLWRVSEKNLTEFYEKKLNYLIPFHYMEETGFLNTEFSGGFQNNFFRGNGYFLFPTIEGIVKTVPENPEYNRLKPGISRILVNDTAVSYSQHVFERSTYSLQFNFQCVNFYTKNNIYFQHKLIGKTNYEWSKPQKQNTVYLKLLPPGKYTFMVRAIDGFNDKHPSVISYSFEIKPYFFETTYFKILLVVFLTIMITLLVRVRILSNKRKIEQREYYKRKISEVELNAIQAQLNPHFIFNCMNTIKYFILEKDFVNANDGLNKLSRLIRNSLENSEDMFIPLPQEITFISNYIDLEKMRLGEQLSYQITVDPDISSQIMIPHLFIQPYIENAIKHGIANLEGRNGLLSVIFTQTDEYIICTVEDNGIGREASARIGLADKSHLSKGTKLTLEKSLLLKQYYNFECIIEIIDLCTANKESNGTRVILSMTRDLTLKKIVSL